MITPEKFGKILNKLPKEKTELSKIELSIASDIKKVLGNSNKLITKGQSEVGKIVKEGDRFISIKDKFRATALGNKKLLENLDEINNQSDKLIKQAESAAKDLGVGASNIDGYNDLTDSLVNAKNAYNRLNQEVEYAFKIIN